MKSKSNKQFILKTIEFGYDLIIADTELTDGLEITDNVEEAQIWDERDVNYKNDKGAVIKLEYWKSYTGYGDLAFVEIN